jgi:hypothetical protein
MEEIRKRRSSSKDLLSTLRSCICCRMEYCGEDVNEALILQDVAVQ